MFVPVVTKDMQLFPQQSARQHAHQRAALKNVRLRAQSLEANLVTTGAIAAPTGAATDAQRSNASAARRSGDSRNCRSVGALPTTSSSAAAGQARSPPKAAAKRPLESIAEGVPLRNAGHDVLSTLGNTAALTALNANNDDESFSKKRQPKSSVKGSKNNNNNNKSTPDLNALKISERQMQMDVNGLLLATTSSSPGLYKAPVTTPTATSNSNGSSSGRSLVKWLTSTLKGRNNHINSSSGKDPALAAECAKCARLDDNCACADSEKTWRSIGDGLPPAPPESPTTIIPVAAVVGRPPALPPIEEDAIK